MTFLLGVGAITCSNDRVIAGITRCHADAGHTKSNASKEREHAKYGNR